MGTSPSATNKVRNEMVRQDILERAASLFEKQGVGSTNIQEIADAMGISRSAIYYYYKSKDHLLEDLISRVTLSSETQIAGYGFTPDMSYREQLAQVIERRVLNLISTRENFRLMERIENDLPPKLARVHQEGKRAIFDELRDFIDAGIKAGEFRPIDSRIITFSIIGMSNWTTWWYSPSGATSPSEIAKEMAQFCVNAICWPDDNKMTKELAFDQIDDLLKFLKTEKSDV